MPKPLFFLAALVTSVPATPPLVAQRPARTVSLGWGVDTSETVVGEIVRTVTAYLQLPSPGRTPTDLWDPEEQTQRRHYDLTAPLVHQGFHATIVEIVPAPGDDDEYVVKTLFASADSTGSNIRPLGLQRLYARRSASGWVLSSALPRLTRSWLTQQRGVIRFHVPPGVAFDATRAQRAAAFVDSLARALDMPGPERIHYYVAGSTEEMWRILGLDYFVSPSGPGQGRGGRAFPDDFVVLSGNPVLGEAYLHELAHVVLAPLARDGIRSGLAHEGVATWLAGSRERSYQAMLEHLVNYQVAFPQTTIQQLLSGRTAQGWGTEEADAFYATGALIAGAVHDRLGPAGIKRLLQSPNSGDPLLEELAQLLGVPTSELDAWWRVQGRRVPSGR